MKNVGPIENETQILDQATKWVVELNSGQLTDTRASELHEWISKSSMHEAMLLKASDVWDEAKNLTAEDQVQTIRPSKPWAFRPSFAVTAVFTVMVASVLFSSITTWSEKETSIVTVDYQTNVGEFKTVTLNDSSKVILNTNSKMSVAFDPKSKERRIFLAKGEAFFDVSKDPSRHFIVDADGREVRAIGTAFNIKLDTAYIEVVVDEGIVELKNKSIESNASTDRLYAGQVIEINNDVRELFKLEPEKIKKKLSWQTGRIIFEGDQLKDVIAEISRYTNTKFAFSDKETELIRIGGSFRIGNVPDLLEAIEEGFDVKVQTTSDGTKMISSKAL